jgi:DNA-binding CsgD family transcriptional regulator
MNAMYPRSPQAGALEMGGSVGLLQHGPVAEIGIAAMDGLRFGVAVVDAAWCVLFANGAALRFLAWRSVFRADSTLRIGFCHAGCQARFRAGLAAALGSASTALPVLDRGGKTVLHATVLPLPSTSCRATRLAMVVLSQPDSSRHFASDVLRQLYGFTRAEVRLANALMAGRTLEEHAADCAVSVETARTQVKAMLAKTGTRRQSELIALLARLPDLN